MFQTYRVTNPSDAFEPFTVQAFSYIHAADLAAGTLTPGAHGFRVSGSMGQPGSFQCFMPPSRVGAWSEGPVGVGFDLVIEGGRP